MKRIVAICLIFVLLCAGCAPKNRVDITPKTDAIQKITVQRTNVDADGKYTYFEKIIETPEEIASFCKKIDKIDFDSIDPVEFSSVDYLIIFDCGKRHKLLVNKDEIIYDGLAYKSTKGKLVDNISELYNQIEAEEASAVSQIFKK